MTDAPLRVLVVATKSPANPVGGGNVALRHLLDALPGAGVDATLLAPTTERPLGVPRRWWRMAPWLLVGTPPSLQRYRSPAFAGAFAARMESVRPQVVHLEQLHLAWLASAARRRGVPVVLRQQNVESTIVARLAEQVRAPLRPLLRLQANRLRAAEAAACGAVDLVAAISDPDAATLRRLAPDTRVEIITAAYPRRGRGKAALEGAPPLVLLGSLDWWPTREGAAWWLDAVWPRLRRELAGAVLHLAGPGSEALAPVDGERVRVHGRVEDAAALLDPRAVAIVPLRAGSGIRLRLLEAWDAGLAVVTTTVGGEGLAANEGDGALVADTADEQVAAIVRVAGDPALRERLATAGAARLAAHAPAAVAQRTASLYRGLAASR